ncbi:MAG: type VII toxin-antitoxin system MntA family adenylyltransferase antitoxin [Acidobacteriota bacterium]
MEPIRDDQLAPAVAEIARIYSLRLVLVFGSQAEGTATAKSDVDIGVITDPFVEINADYDLALQEAFFKIFGTDRVDLIYLDKASPLLRYRAFSNALVLFDRDKMFDRLASYAARYYADTTKFRDLQRRFIEAFVAHDN